MNTAKIQKKVVDVMGEEILGYAVETACDKNGWILGYTVNPGNQQDSRTFSRAGRCGDGYIYPQG